jgi:hypothetical protein
LAEYSDWPGPVQVFRLARRRLQTKSGKREREIVSGLTSLPPADASAARLLALNRASFGIEDSPHRRRDATVRDDGTRPTRGHAGRVIAFLNNLVVGLLRAAGHTNLAATRRRYDADLLASLALVAPPPRL